MNLQSASPTILLVEDNVSGHRLYYVRLLAEEATSRGYSVHLATSPGATDTAEFHEHLGACAPYMSLSTHTHLNLEAIERIGTQLGAVHTVVPDGDATAVQLARRGRWRGQSTLALLIMREASQPDKNRVRKLGKELAKRVVLWRVRNMRGVQMAVLKASIWSGKSKARVALDPIEVKCTKDDAFSFREAWNLDNDTYWFAALGAISPRKNVPLILESLAKVNSDRRGLLIAGRIEPEVREEIDRRLMSSPDRVVVIDRILTDQELDSAVTAADCVVLAHSNEGPSGLLGKSAAAGTRIIAAGAKSLRKDVQSLGSSAEWTALNSGAISDAMNRAILQRAPQARNVPPRELFADALLPAN